jgi:DMSO/TMAO reductase YedYZ molybdopterin-dependent catalytic subunit
MLIKKGSHLCISLVIILTVGILALSCSSVASNPTLAPSPNAETFTTNQTLTSEMPTPTPSIPSPTPSIPSTTLTIPSSTDLSLLINSDPAKVDNSKLPITPVDQLHTTGSAPEIDISKYRLIVDGLVSTPLSLTYEDIMQYPTVTEVVLLICPGVFVDNAQWTGVPVTTILAEAGVKQEAKEVTFYAADQYQITFSLTEVERDGVFLSHTVDGQILPKEHGYPLRLVVKGEYGSNWVKWVDHIEIK